MLAYITKDIKTIEGLAAIITTHIASKEDIKRVESRLDGIDGRLDRIEHQILVYDDGTQPSKPRISGAFAS